MGSANSINSLISSSVSYASLSKLANGTYNKGEITFKDGFLGGFNKVNNHVGALSGFNTVVTTEAQNRVTNAAVFKAILTRFGGADRQDDVNAVMNMDLEDDKGEILEKLSEFKNPFIKEAFEFLLEDGGKNPLSRDEMKKLDMLLKHGALLGQRSGGIYAKTMARGLNDLREFKAGRLDAEQSWRVKNSVTGASTEKGAVERSRANEVTANQIASRLRTRIDNESDGEYRSDMQTIVKDDELLSGISFNVSRAIADIPEKEWNGDNIDVLAKKLASGIGEKYIKFGLKNRYGYHSMTANLKSVADVIYEACKEMKPSLFKAGTNNGFGWELFGAVSQILEDKVGYHVRDNKTGIGETFTNGGVRVIDVDHLFDDDDEGRPSAIN